MICIHCGEEIPEGTEFCPNCGMKQTEEKDNTKVGIVFLVIIALVVCLIAGCVIYNVHQEKEREKRIVEIFKNSNFDEEMQGIVSDYEEKTDEIISDMERDRK
jgi:predicted nucleic acid-binding Zn ribbon protein